MKKSNEPSLQIIQRSAKEPKEYPRNPKKTVMKLRKLKRAKGFLRSLKELRGYLRKPKNPNHIEP